MENFFSRFGLDIIGKAVFNYDFDSLTHDDPVIQVCPRCEDPAPSESNIPAQACTPPVLRAGSHARRRLPPTCDASATLCCPAGRVHDAARGRVPQHLPHCLLEHCAAQVGAAAPPCPAWQAGRAFIRALAASLAAAVSLLESRPLLRPAQPRVCQPAEGGAEPTSALQTGLQLPGAYRRCLASPPPADGLCRGSGETWRRCRSSRAPWTS